MIQKNELDFTPSVKLGPIIGDINLKKKIKNRCSSGDQTSNASISYTGIILVHHYLKLLFVLFCQLSCLIGPQHFFENSYSLAFKLVLQNRFHGLSFTIDFFQANVYS